MSSNAELFWGEHAMFTVHCLNSLEGFLKSETASHSIANQPCFKIPNGLLADPLFPSWPLSMYRNGI